ncbi:hypothetical protein C8Q80DRAFT_1276575 [Daedaleopsis nitida]|nr:hypothetical protein C8Q80DRAFT_1276575 [Daedaleopsis nitida]
MFKLAIILSFTVAAVSGAATQDLTGMSEVAKASADGVAQGTSGLLPLCDDILLTSSQSEPHMCIVQLDSQASTGATPSQNVTASPADGLTCAQNVIAPSLGDAQNLCNNFVPSGQYTVAASPASNQCTCIQFSLNSAPSALFRACNCDYCSAATFANIKGDCQTIASSCVAHGVGGFATHTAPNTYDILFLANSEPPIPIDTNC